jgi:hypothetical protein
MKFRDRLVPKSAQPHWRVRFHAAANHVKVDRKTKLAAVSARWSST